MSISCAVFNYCLDRGIDCKRHDSPGLYFDVRIGERMFMLDASPDDQDQPYPPGLLVVRDETHSAEAPTRIGAVNVLEEVGRMLLDGILGISTNPVEHENIDVRCVTCKQAFVTCRVSFDMMDSECPSCGGWKLAEN